LVLKIENLLIIDQQTLLFMFVLNS